MVGENECGRLVPNEWVNQANGHNKKKMMINQTDWQTKLDAKNVDDGDDPINWLLAGC